MFNLVEEGNSIPAGFCSVGRLVNWLAEQLAPIPSIEPTVKKIIQQYRIDENHCKQKDITTHDRAELDLLESIFKACGLDYRFLFSGDCTKKQYDEFKAAFDASKIKPDWDIVATFRDHQHEAHETRANIRKKQFEALESMAQNGMLRVLSSDALTPMDKITHVSIISHGDTKKYLEGLGYLVRDTPKQSTSNNKDNTPPKPWLIADPKDPQPNQPWYTPARYFARQLVIDDSNLLMKRNLLAAKVVKSLTDVGIKKRGGKKPFDASTILKALTNVNLG